MREAAQRIRQLLDAGVEPESVAVVVRRLEEYAAPLRRELDARGVPFSGGELPAGYWPELRRLQARVELLERGAEAELDRWFESGAAGADGDDLRLALRSVGAARLGDAAELAVDELLGGRRELALPVRGGLEEEEDGTARARRRGLPREVLQAACGRARELAEAVAGWPAEASLAEHVARARALFEATPAWSAALDALGEALPGGGAGAAGPLFDAEAPFARDEFLLLLQARLEAAFARPLGGAGAGVQVLDVARARGLTFAHLFALGVSRDAFPRSVRQDPLLPDGVRARLQALLPDLHQKREGFDEERYLFAELLSSAEHVTLSWQRADDEGAERAPSPFVERLRAGDSAPEVDEVPRAPERALSPPWAGGEGRPRTARESLLLAGLGGARPDWPDYLELGLGERALARARAAVLAEWEPDRRTAEGRARLAEPSPFAGLVGARGAGGDPRANLPFVTLLESVARCPWQGFLGRLLGLEPGPDPLAALPGIDPLLVGNAVHDALEGLVREALGGERPRALEEALAAGATELGRPPADAVRRWVQRAAVQVAREAGLHLAGLHRALARLAEPLVERALELDWPAAGARVAVVGAELEGRVRVPDPGGGEPRALAFRADRVDRVDGALRLTDYKTGRPVSDAKTPAKRREKLLLGIARGARLQVAAYAACGEAEEAAGRYLFLRPDLADHAAVAEVPAGEAEAREAFEHAASLVLANLERGVLPPRLELPDGATPAACGYCELRDACCQGDSGARERLAALARGAAERAAVGEDLDAVLRGLVQLWYLGEVEA